MNKLAILIPTIVGREHYLDNMLNNIESLLTEENKHRVQVFILSDNREKSIGEKRNILIEMAVEAGCTYRAFIDDDDEITEHYINECLKGMDLDVDTCSLKGKYFVNGAYDKPFIHSIKYKGANTNAEFYERPPNHLNCTKLSLIADIKYPHTNFGEDMTHAEEVAKLGRLNTEYWIEPVIYNYLFRTKTNGI